MTSKGKPPPPERSLTAIWHLLSVRERAQLKTIGGLPRDWKPDLREPPSAEQQLEGIEELRRIMPLPPGRIAQWKEELLQRVEPEEGQ